MRWNIIKHTTLDEGLGVKSLRLFNEALFGAFMGIHESEAQSLKKVLASDTVMIVLAGIHLHFYTELFLSAKPWKVHNMTVL